MCGRIDVDRMLSEVDSLTITEWKAFERKNGRVDQTWEQHAFALIDLRLQQLLEITVAANTKNGKGPKVEMIPLPWEIEEHAEKQRGPVRTPEQVRKGKEDFYRTLEERNRRRGITPESLAERKAKRGNRAPTKRR